MAATEKPSPYAIVRVTDRDLAVVRKLLRMFGNAFDDPAYHESAPSDAYLAKLLGSDQFLALAATSADEVVGGLAAYELKKFEQERSELYVYDLAVAEAHRRQGIATRLIEELARVGNERGVSGIFVQADPEDGPAVALYDSLSLRQTVFHFDIPLTLSPQSSSLLASRGANRAPGFSI